MPATVSSTHAACPPPGAPEWEQRAHDALARAGYRSGGARRSVIELLAGQGGCVDADELVRRLREDGRRVGTASVYRTLGLLAELGLVHRVALAGGPARYELVHPDGEHHHHAVCGSCGRTEVFTDHRLERAIELVSRRSSFEVRAHDVTLHGTCGRCASASADGAPAPGS